jgi:hypothetical protein
MSNGVHVELSLIVVVEVFALLPVLRAHQVSDLHEIPAKLAQSLRHLQHLVFIPPPRIARKLFGVFRDQLCH